MSLSFDVRARFGDGAESFRLTADATVASGETLVVLGPSGSGKTLLLECLGGFHDHDGVVEIAGRDVTDAPPETRDAGLLFQSHALFPHLTVRENVGFGRRYHETTREPATLLERLAVSELADRRPETLSGGERQRVALARTLAVDPGVLLLDEPLAALDVPTRETLRDDLGRLLADRTVVYVTHDRTTARALGDRIAVVHDGEVVQRGSPSAVFERPESEFVARFVGANVLPAGVGAPRPTAVRPEAVALVSPTDTETVGCVRRRSRVETAHRVVVAVDGVEVVAYTDDPPAVDDRIGLQLPSDPWTIPTSDGDRTTGRD
ncbi:ABC transporter ATP-binding protein [Halobaculum sp. MBLA0143]|uniref:ABC transporter ATP-binding protein n=1 Tax=Halobaculum sp. MBLA0143 TaxID=3079933 RepID=UPI0035232658